MHTTTIATNNPAKSSAVLLRLSLRIARRYGPTPTSDGSSGPGGGFPASGSGRATVPPASGRANEGSCVVSVGGSSVDDPCAFPRRKPGTSRAMLYLGSLQPQASVWRQLGARNAEASEKGALVEGAPHREVTTSRAAGW